LTELVIHLDSIDPVICWASTIRRLQILRNAFPRVKFTSRGNRLKIEVTPEDLERVEIKLTEMVTFIEKYGRMSDKTLEDLIMILSV